MGWMDALHTPGRWAPDERPVAAADEASKRNELRRAIAGRFEGLYVSDGDRMHAGVINGVVDAIIDVSVDAIDLETRLGVERSKWCHHCGAPWDWARPCCKWCGTSRPPVEPNHHG
jgi:hypothetical protein